MLQVTFPHRSLHRKLTNKLPIEFWVFSLKVPSHYFFENDAINLLYARRRIVKYIEQLVGPFRDYNGGLFEKQQERFESFKTYLAATIPHFPLFAEKILYALQPIEARLSLSLKAAERLLITFSNIIEEKSNLKVLRHPEGVLVVKTTNFSLLLPLIRKTKEWEEYLAYAQLTLSDFHYLCVLDKTNTYLSPLELLLKQPIQSPKKCPTLRLSFEEGAPPSLNPHHVLGDVRCRVLSKLLFEGLTRIDDRGRPKLAGAKNISCSKDGLSYTFQIRPHCWSNGEKVTAFHYANCYRYLLSNPNFTRYSTALFAIKNAQRITEKRCPIKKLGISAVNADTLTIQLEWPDPTFLYKLAQPLFFPTIETAREPQLFNGPYIVQKRDSYGMFLERNPYYWDHPNIFFQLIHVEWKSDIKQCYDLFLQDKVDWIGDPLNRLTFEMVLKKKQEIQQLQVARALWLYINTQHPPLASTLIRKALSLAIDRSLIAEHILIGNLPLYQPLPNTLSLYSNSLSDDDPIHAKQLFKQGLSENNLTTLSSLTLNYPNTPGRKPLVEYLKEVWEKTFGIKVHLQATEWNVFRSSLEEGNFQMGVSGASALYPDPTALLDRFESLEECLSHWEHPLYQEKLMLAREATEPEQRSRLLGEAEAILVEELPFMPLCNFVSLYPITPN